jgi:hypothetical protein
LVRSASARAGCSRIQRGSCAGIAAACCRTGASVRGRRWGGGKERVAQQARRVAGAARPTPALQLAARRL